MSYNRFEVRNIFTDPRLNATCDFLLESIFIAFPKSEDEPDDSAVNGSFLLSGKAAAILQGQTGTLSNVTFITDKDYVYKWCVENLGTKVFKCRQLAFKNRILFYPQPDLFFELWFTNVKLSIATSDEILLQEVSQIPTETL